MVLNSFCVSISQIRENDSIPGIPKSHAGTGMPPPELHRCTRLLAGQQRKRSLTAVLAYSWSYRGSYSCRRRVSLGHTRTHRAIRVRTGFKHGLNRYHRSNVVPSPKLADSPKKCALCRDERQTNVRIYWPAGFYRPRLRLPDESQTSSSLHSPMVQLGNKK